jgi:hypothetical protein
LNDPITREQVVTILYRYDKVHGLDMNNNISEALSEYTDKNDISDWSFDAMRWAVAKGFVQGRTANIIAPQGISTRAEIATILKRYIENLLITLFSGY